MGRLTEISAVLLCGGQSERMGFPKEMLRVDGAPLAVHMVRRLEGLFEKVFVSTNHPAYLRHLLGVSVLEDEVPGAGPLAGILTGLRRCGTRQVFFLACDMPTVHNDAVQTLLDRALGSDAPAVCARCGGAPQPLCGVYAASIAPAVEQAVQQGADRSVQSLLGSVGAQWVELPAFGDVDAPEDLAVLGEVFREVEPLPVRRAPVRRLGGAPLERDTVAEEWPVTVLANGVRLATVLCTPTALRELAVGFAAYLGLLSSRGGLRSVAVDYEARRVRLELEADEARIRSAVQQLVSSACGAALHGTLPPPVDIRGEHADVRVSRSHLLECVRGLREMAPVFARTGCTHQAAFSDGQRVRIFYEDVGRHNAMDKVIGRALMDGVDLSSGVLVSTGRLGSEVVVKALRQGVPVLAAPSAVTAAAVHLAVRHGLTLVGFARASRVNVYAGAQRVRDA